MGSTGWFFSGNVERVGRSKVHFSRTSGVADITICPTCGVSLPRTQTTEVWIETELAGGWKVCLYIVPQGGEPTVAEARVLPAEQDAQPGTWSMDPAVVPPGGLSSHLVRQIKVVEPLAVGLPQLLKALRRQAGDQAVDRVTRRHGFTKAVLDEPVRPGRPGHPDRYYAEIARDYVQALGRGSRSPNVDVAAALEARGQARSVSAVAGLINRARGRGLLTRPLMQGRPGGELTDHAKAVLGRKTKGEQK